MKRHLPILIILVVILIQVGSVYAAEDNITIEELESDIVEEDIVLQDFDNVELRNASYDLKELIVNANDGDNITIEPGTYSLHDINITKSITIQGKGKPEEVIIDGENKSNIFIIQNDALHVSFKNITFINAKTEGFGGAISIETGHVYVDNCHFINNTAGVNAGGISNYGTEENKGYLLVNNSLFMNNHAGHDGGAVTTCYANSDIYNSVFIGNTAIRDGGAIRVSVQGYGNVQDCIFMYNHADEWGGAYYSWSGESNINRCIFLNNTAGTNGGAVMVSGDLNLENSIIMNNDGGKVGGSFYIQQPMYNAITSINIHNNLITNNSSPNGKEIFIKWKDTVNLYTDFNNNDWGDEDPNDPSVIDPNKVTIRSKVTSTTKSDLLTILSLNALIKYSELIKDYFPDGYLDNIKKQAEKSDYQNDTNDQTSDSNNPTKTVGSTNNSEISDNEPNNLKSKDSKTADNTDSFRNATGTTDNANSVKNTTDNPNNLNLNATQVKSNLTSQTVNENSNSKIIIGNSTTHGEDKKAYELNETQSSAVKQGNSDIKYFIATIAIVFILLAIGYKRNKKEE